MLKTVAVDFDHTLVDGDKPLPGAREAMEKLKAKGYMILIHSCNNLEWIKKVLRASDIPFDYVWDNNADMGKPICAAYVDDRAINFDGDWERSLADLETLEERRNKIKGLI